MLINRRDRSNDVLVQEISKHLSAVKGNVYLEAAYSGSFFMHKKAAGMSDGRWGIRVN
ncbi:hypothetical protein J32TS2_31670 [Shouchella clausii]|nr:hypothetical protein J32TS2_31670 [Shouchella clausii]